ncbi:hypothetical protein HJD18_01270 [Thermoleophilia bacterium SCSIO 60948]|nr:hypothetical protein HJD18_01270 [Thermoleophilia bacterium SCSIO 60948]
METTFIFLHVLSAFAVLTTIVIHSAYAVGTAPERAASVTADALWNIGAGGTIIFGLILSIGYDTYDFFSFWIIAALILWLGTGEIGRRAQLGFAAGDAAGLATGRRFHWIRTAVVLLILVLMVWKPGA